MSKLSQTNVEVGIESLPVGFIFPVANTNTPPSGTLECNGASISQTTYADLFSGQPLSIGTYYDPTPPGGQFRLPDYRGRFLRGWAHGSSRDPDRAARTPDHGGGPTGDVVGSKQGDELGSHRHQISPNYLSTPNDGHGGGGDNMTPQYYSNYTGGNETRPKNINVMWVIKY